MRRGHFLWDRMFCLVFLLASARPPQKVGHLFVTSCFVAATAKCGTSSFCTHLPDQIGHACETRMIHRFILALWRSVTKAWAGREQENDCPIADYTKAIEANPHDGTAYLGRGTAHLRALDFDNAIADLTKLIELEPNQASAYAKRGKAHYEKGEFDRAVADLTKAIEINPKLAIAHSDLGWSYEAIGDEKKAIAHYRKALEIDPSLESARDNLKLLHAMPERQPFMGGKGVAGTEG
jgi:cytochrome c-type biogenesis protein CcmH/NrfG